MSDDQAFVVMQIGAKDSPERKRADETFDFIVKPALAQFKIKAYRADLDPSPGGITAKMLTELLESRLVIADLSGRNPNVFYELGIAHSFARPLVSIVDSVDALPFDTKDQRVIELGAYSESGLTYAQGETAKKSLIASLEIVLADGYAAPSPVREVAGSQSLDALAPENPLASELGAMRETIDEIRSIVTPRVRTAVPKGMLEDLQRHREIIEELLASGVVKVGQLPELISLETTSEFDDWARALTHRWAGVGMTATSTLNAADPWAQPAAPDPWAQAPKAVQDEPPF